MYVKSSFWPNETFMRYWSYNLHIILEQSMLSKRQRQARLQQLFIHSDSLWVSLGSGYVNFSEGPTRSHERIPKEPNFVLRCELMMWLMWPSFVWSERLLARHESQDHAVAWIQDAAAQKPKTTAKLQRDQYEVYLTPLEFSTWKAAFLDLLALSLTDTWTCTWGRGTSKCTHCKKWHE